MTRAETLMKMFLKMNQREPKQDDLWILDLITRLKEVYDLNYTDMRNCPKGFESSHNDKMRLSRYQDRERILNNIGELLREYIGISIPTTTQDTKKYRAEDKKDDIIYSELEKEVNLNMEGENDNKLQVGECLVV